MVCSAHWRKPGRGAWVSAPAVMWWRRDLRLGDLPALSEALKEGEGRVVPLFVADPVLLGRSGPNRRAFLAQALRSLDERTGGRICIRMGEPARVVKAVAEEAGAKTVLATADFAPYGRRRDDETGERLARAGIELRLVGSPYVHSPGSVRGSGGTRLRTFSSYFRAWESRGWPGPMPVPAMDPVGVPGELAPADLAGVAANSVLAGACGLPDWWEGLPLGRAASLPAAGEAAAERVLEDFCRRSLAAYARCRDLLGVDGTSRLSPYLRFGCLHPRTVLEVAGTGRDAERLRAELAWREFYADVLWHEPSSARRSLQVFGDHLRWDTGSGARERFRAWATGRTGFELVDAAMRQLLHEGWVHNRARMVAASFLVKDLHLDWRLGARWFMWHLVDGDLASNQHGWQWVAGTGTDAAPFHRIFNPDLQRERFDPDGSYVARWLGTAARPARVVDHASERREALVRFADARAAALRPGD